MALIREIISLSPSRSGDGSGYFDVYGKEKISPEAGRRPSESSTSSAEGSSSSGSNESSEYVRRGSTVTFISKAERVVLNQKRICEVSHLVPYSFSTPFYQSLTVWTFSFDRPSSPPEAQKTSRRKTKRISGRPSRRPLLLLSLIHI